MRKKTISYVCILYESLSCIDQNRKSECVQCSIVVGSNNNEAATTNNREKTAHEGRKKWYLNFKFQLKIIGYRKKTNWKSTYFATLHISEYMIF